MVLGARLFPELTSEPHFWIPGNRREGWQMGWKPRDWGAQCVLSAFLASAALPCWGPLFILDVRPGLSFPSSLPEKASTPLKPRVKDTHHSTGGFPSGSVVKNSPANQETCIPSLGQEDALEKEIATHSSILAWKISWTEAPGGLQSVGLRRVGH